MSNTPTETVSDRYVCPPPDRIILVEAKILGCALGPDIEYDEIYKASEVLRALVQLRVAQITELEQEAALAVILASNQEITALATLFAEWCRRTLPKRRNTGPFAAIPPVAA